jgi:ribosome-binding protein aMBF1 (putative translation factor)
MLSVLMLSTSDAVAVNVPRVPSGEYEAHKRQFGERLRAAREKRGWSQMALARLLPRGTDVSQVSRWERGVTFPSFESLLQLARVLNVTPQWLEWGNDDV